MNNERYKTLKDFYPFYLSEHSNKTNRILHFIGTSLVISFVVFIILMNKIKFIIFAPLIGYGFAWVGHFIFEKNRPATFKYPLYSFISDFIMWYQLITKKISFDSKS